MKLLLPQPQECTTTTRGALFSSHLQLKLQYNVYYRPAPSSPKYGLVKAAFEVVFRFVALGEALKEAQ